MPTIKLQHVDGKYLEEIPLVIFLLTTFFESRPEHFTREGLFRVNGDKQKIEELSIYLSMGDFSILKKFEDCPNEVANFLKELLRELREPICPFNKYTSFRDIQKNSQPGQKLEEIIALLRDLPPLNRSTLIYLSRFFKRVSEFSDKNKMNQYNLAVIISPNLFRSRELSNMDLINQGNLADVFTVLMNNTDYIVSRIQ
jgi:hypothetical protein